ncbi:TetR family transcriptional regulator [Levilactobacillus zymae]|uniref:TetR family transcriptional regulator n=1 Tax=Levilactobacillus zymae TaxID=267363 RepID=A0ABQ0WZP6_9LACO|nr:TetR/AcrR family transcriptional regulator [Levilactobacillus zymae]KRL12500.1 transcription regulator [Levilactobacillus zymae DSM 19395]QFR61670.1 TetR family transcriptional regulator [Levilactobacillus zymae]GEO72902.1 TetR family transcriptional regulator [Levilactobacillus zymae]
MANIYTPDQKNAKRQAMMQAAVRLFTQQSYTAITMQQVATAVGSSKGTVFHYFATKEDLFMSILLENYQAYFQQLITELTAGPQLTRTTFSEWLVGQSQNLIEHHATLVRLNAIRGPILEGKANMAETVAQRNRLYAVSQQLGDTLVYKTDHLLSQSQFSHLFVIQSGQISGLMNMASLARFNHQTLSVAYPDFDIQVVLEAKRQLRYYLTGYLRDYAQD